MHKSVSYLKAWLSARSRELTVMPFVAAVLLLLLLPAAYFVIEGVGQEAFAPNAVWRLVGNVDFKEALWKTFTYAGITTLAQSALGLCAAVVVHRFRIGIPAAVFVLFLPYCGPTLISVLQWFLLLSPDGLLAKVSWQFARIDPYSWRISNLFLTGVLVSIWQFYPFVFLSLLARLWQIPEQYFRASRLEGATPLQQFLYITWPTVRSTLLVILALRFVIMLTKFDTLQLVGGGTAVREAVETVPLRISFLLGAQIRQSMLLALVLAAAVAVIVWAFTHQWVADKSKAADEN